MKYGHILYLDFGFFGKKQFVTLLCGFIKNTFIKQPTFTFITLATLLV